MKDLIFYTEMRWRSIFSNDPANKEHCLVRQCQTITCFAFMLLAFIFDVLCQWLSESVSQRNFYLQCLRNIKYIDGNPGLFWCYKNRLLKSASLSTWFCILIVLSLCLHYCLILDKIKPFQQFFSKILF